jgi:hypothetical protein
VSAADRSQACPAKPITFTFASALGIESSGRRAWAGSRRRQPALPDGHTLAKAAPAERRRQRLARFGREVLSAT